MLLLFPKAHRLGIDLETAIELGQEVASEDDDAMKAFRQA
jgi:hypothetical protein